jgi:site-specific recombinase XerC
MPTLSGRFIKLCERNPDGSYATRANRRQTLLAAGRTLRDLGYRLNHPQGLKPKHVEALVKHWQDQGQSTGTLKNKLAALRWWAEKINKASVIARDNAHYGIGTRNYVTAESKAKEIGSDQLQRITDARVRMSLELQRAFGLRREEAIKFQPAYADRGDKLVLKASWTKGGKAREIPIRTDDQRAALQTAHQVAGKSSLIAPERTYVQQLRIYERQTANAGLRKLHGLRHQYAQARYRALTEEMAGAINLPGGGWRAPVAGGPSREALSPAQRGIDRLARVRISRELGHEREQITTVYLGR